MRLGKGMFFRKLYGESSPEPLYLPVPEDPWDGAGPAFVEEHIQWLKENSILHGVEYKPSALVSARKAKAQPAAREAENGEPKQSTRRQSTSTSKNSR